MKRCIFIALLSLCLLLTACAVRSSEKPADVPVVPDTTQEKKTSPDAATTKEETPLHTQQQTDTTDSDQQQEQEKKQEVVPPPPKYQPLTPVSADAERIVRASQYGLTAAMEDALLTLQDRYYQAMASLTAASCKDLFTTAEEADRHEAIWHSLIEIRKASLIDLHLADYSFTFYCTGVSWTGEEEVRITLLEDAVMYFAATAYVPSEQFDVAHTFVLARTGQDSWKLKSHQSDDNPYDNFSYDKVNQCDTRLNAFLSAVSARQAQRGSAGGAAGKTWDHDYDRSAAYAYMQTYAAYRNGDWHTYDYSGGNCQNFGSQVLHAGGIPMDQDGDAQWYWKSYYDQNYSWINVPRFMNYARSNAGYGLVCDADANYYDGQTGDILIMGDGDMDHTTVIADTITGGDGQTADYLICSNTSNYRNFPASAYYYTYHWVVRIFGWNDIKAPAEDPELPDGEGDTSQEQPGTEGEGSETPPAGGGQEDVPPADGEQGEVTPPTDGEQGIPTPPDDNGQGENGLPETEGDLPADDATSV